MGELKDPVSLTVQTVNGPETVTGVQLGASSSYRGHHTHTGDFQTAGVRCAACRWMQVTILFDTEAEQYVAVVEGKSVVPGETDRCRVERTTSPIWVIETLAQPQRQVGEPARLSRTALKAVAEAARFDADIADAYARHRELVG